jgi:hypothetical protein
MATLEGVNRKNFQLNTKSWRLLTDFIFDRCKDLIKADEMEGWHDGYGKIISHDTAIAIANRLEALIEQGVVRHHITELEIIKMESYFTEENLRKFIEFCRHSGGFDIW